MSLVKLNLFNKSVKIMDNQLRIQYIFSYILDLAGLKQATLTEACLRARVCLSVSPCVLCLIDLRYIGEMQRSRGREDILEVFGPGLLEAVQR